MEPVTQQQEIVTKQKNPLRIEQGKKLVEYNKCKKEELKRLNSVTKLSDRSNSGTCDPATRNCNQTEEPSEN